MKRIVIIFFTFVMTGCNESGNSDNDSKVIVVENLRVDTMASKNKLDISILLGCGAAGTSSDQFDSTKILVFKKDYKRISKNLCSQDLITQIASVIAMETLYERKRISLSEEELGLIKKIKALETSCSVCQGCTGHFNGKISDIFDEQNPENVIEAIRYSIGLLPE